MSAPDSDAAKPGPAPGHEERLTRLVHAGDGAGCVAFLLGLREKQRRALHDRAIQLVAERNRLHERHGTESPETDAARLAWLATCPPSDFVRLSPPSPRTLDLVCDLVIARLPEGSAARARFSRHVHVDGFLTWELSRRLEARGIGPLPGDDERLPRFLWELGGWPRPPDLAPFLRAEPALLRFVWPLFRVPEAGEHLTRHDPATRIEPRPRLPDGTVIKTPRWDDAIVALAQEGLLPRDRLLDETLAALAEPARPGLPWFARFHARLAPAVDEAAARAPRYLALLAAREDAAVSVAMATLRDLLLADRLDGARLLEAMAASPGPAGKGAARRWLSLIVAVAKRAKPLRPVAALAACSLLRHAAAEVQLAALAAIEELGDRTDVALRDGLREAAPTVSALARERLAPWLDPEEPAAEDDGEAAKWRARAEALPPALRRAAGIDEALAALAAPEVRPPPLPLDPLSIPRLGQPLEPVTGVAELVDLALAACEGALGPDDLERVLDGIARLGLERPAGFSSLAAPIAVRALERIARIGVGTSLASPRHPFAGMDPLLDLMALMVIWIEIAGGQPVEWKGLTLGWHQRPELAGRRLEWRGAVAPAVGDPGMGPSPNAFLGERLRQVARRLSQGQARPLLSTPTHAGGFLDPRVLVARARSGPTDPWDAVVALLRLAPEHRDEARLVAGDLPGELGAAVRYALDAHVPPGDIGETASLWFAAARARSPLGDARAIDRRHPDGGPDGAWAARYFHYPAGYPVFERGSLRAAFANDADPLGVIPARPATLPLDRLPGLWHLRPTGSLFHPNAAWVGSLWPLVRLPAFADEARRLVCFVNSQGLYWKGDWEGLFDPDAALGLPGTLLIALGLGARQPTVSKLAEDALLATLDDGRLDPGALGEVLAALLAWPEHTPARLVRALGEVARLGPLPLDVLRTAVAHALALARPPDARALPLLTLLLDWLVTAGLPLSHLPAREWLATRSSGGGKLAVTARALLALERTSRATAHHRAVTMRVLASRVERAERWRAIARLTP